MNTIDWKKLVNLQYWFEGVAGDTSITPTIQKNTFFFWFFLTIFSIIFTVGITLKIAQLFMHPLNPLTKKFSILSSNLISMGITGIIWFCLRQLSVGFLGARFWLLIIGAWAGGLAFWLGKYFSYAYKFESLYFQKKILGKE
jgi:hypothetical protein